MARKLKDLLASELKDSLPPEAIRLLPSHYQRIGDIVVLSLDERLGENATTIGETLLRIVPRVRTVCIKKGAVKGQFREPQVEVVAGDRNTITIHRENRCLYKIDVARLMLAKGNVTERARLPRIVKPQETIVDMFAGIGYFTIPIAVLADPKKIFAIDINPRAIDFLRENVLLNKVSHVVEPIVGDCRDVASRLEKVADRVIMGFFPGTSEFLPAAFRVLRPEGGVIHYHDTFRDKEVFDKPMETLRQASEGTDYRINAFLYKGVVKHYAPRIVHVVLDVEFRRSRSGQCT